MFFSRAAARIAQLRVPARQVRQYYIQHNTEEDLNEMPVAFGVLDEMALLQ